VTLKATKFPGVYTYSLEKKVGAKPDATFYVKYRDHLGRQVREKVGRRSEGMTASKAAKIRFERIRAIENGDQVQSRQERRKAATSFADYAENEYFAWAKANKSSWPRELSTYKIWIKPVIGSKALAAITIKDLEKIQEKMATAGRAPRTIRYAFDIVRQIFNHATVRGAFKGTNPATLVKRPQADNRRVRFLTEDEAKALLAELKRRSRQTYEMALLSLQTGMRAGEIFNLRWQDLDFENKLINIMDTKSGRNRQAHMTPEVEAMLKAKAQGAPGDLVFPDRNGRRIVQISNAFERAVAALGLNDGISDPRQKVVFHTLRHTFASWLAMAGTPLHVIKELMGHQTLAMTERYSHLLPDTKVRALAALPRLSGDAT